MRDTYAYRLFGKLFAIAQIIEMDLKSVVHGPAENDLARSQLSFLGFEIK